MSRGSATPGGPVVILRTLGGAEAVVEPAISSGDHTLGPGKPLALLVWLASMPDRTCSRDQAIDLLWSDAEPEQARHALRQTLWYLRRRLHDSVIVATRESLALGLPVRSDHAEFLTAVAAGRFESALDLYNGDFLPDLALPGGVDFEHWADVERRQIRLAFVHAARAVARSWISSARHREAIALARQVRDVEPTEASWRLLLEALIAARDSVGAALEVEALEHAIGTESLEASTRALMRTAIRAPSTTDAPERGRETGLIAELVGRESEFAAIINAWEKVRGGDAVAIRLIGAAGLGKTRLLNDLAARFRAMRARVVTVSARPADRQTALSHAADLAAALASLKGAAAISTANAAALIDLNPSLSSVFAGPRDVRPGEHSALHRILALRELIAMIADEAPFVLLLDDHHWADAESRRLIAGVIARLGHAAALVVIASRPGYSEIAIDDARRVELQPLSGASTTGLVASIAELPAAEWSGPFAMMLHDVSGGSPLLVLETLQSLMERQILGIEEGRWIVRDPAQLLAARHAPNAIDARVQSSSPEERTILAVLAVFGAPMAASLIAATLMKSEGSIGGVLAALEARGLVAGDGARWWPSHDLLSESFAERLSSEDRARIERAIADQLLMLPAEESNLVRAARHYAAAGATEQIVDAFIAWLELRRRAGDLRPVRALGAAFSPDLAIVPGLWRRVPMNLRFPRWRSVAGVAAAAIIVTFSMAKALAPNEPPPDASIAVFYDSAGASHQWEIPIYRGALANGDLIEVSRGTRKTVAMTPPRIRFAISPDGRHWAGDVIFSDSNGMDVLVTDDFMRNQRRVSSEHDDLAAAWSPDGRYLVFATGRFHPERWNDLAIVERATGSVRQITSGPDTDIGPAWNPLGTRIAFTRRLRDQSKYELCEVAPDGSTPRCQPYGSRAVNVLGWYDDNRMIVTVELPDTAGLRPHSIRLVDFDDSGATRELAREALLGPTTLSPDGRWIACACQVTAAGRQRWFVYPLDNPLLRTEVVRDRIDARDMMVIWTGRRREHQYLDRLEIDRGDGVQPINVPFKLRAHGFRADQRLVDDVPARWSIVAGDAARLDGDVLVPIQPGTVRVKASAGGWRMVERDIIIGEASLTPVTRIPWAEPLSQRWISFGTPVPYTAADSMFGRAFFVNGDGEFSSGIVSRQVFSTTGGLHFRAPISVRAVDGQWQSMSWTVIEEPDTASVDPVPTDSAGPSTGRRSCSVGVPYGEGMHLRQLVGIGSDFLSKAAETSSASITGRPQVLTLQVFPDGSCAATLDGRIVGHIRPPGLPMRRVRLVISGQAYKTRVAVGLLEVLSGTDPSIDWRPKR